jgi:anti-anti-sigma factor
VSTSRHSSASPADPTTEDPGTPDRETSLPASATITGADGTVLATISRHSEQPVPEQSGSSGQAPLIVIDVVGDIDADTAPLLHTALTQAVRRNRQVCCDLSRVAFVGAAGVNTILAALHDADAAGGVLTVRGVHGIGARVFQVTGLDAVLAARA